jgi:hypothetical protein
MIRITNPNPSEVIEKSVVAGRSLCALVWLRVNLGNSVTDKRGSTLERRITPKMVDIQMPGYQVFWTETNNKLKSEYQQLIGQFPAADAQLKQLLKVIRDIEEMAMYIPASVGESEQWPTIDSTAEENIQNFCKVLNGKNLFNALYGSAQSLYMS